ncbi:hypothetical protein D3C80_1918340 [compost metagenome]
MGQVQAVVEQHFIQVRRAAQIGLPELLGIEIQGLVVLHLVAPWIALAQVIAQAVAGNHLAHLLLQVWWVGLHVA